MNFNVSKYVISTINYSVMNNFITRGAIFKYSISITNVPTSNVPTKWRFFNNLSQ